MFENKDAKKRKLEAAYGKGMEKARQTGAVEGFTDAMASLILPDSMGTEEYQSYRQGYHDYVSSEQAKGRASSPKEAAPLDASEKTWYALCNSSDFIPEEIVSRYQEALFARGKHVTIAVGLSDFTAHVCPRCVASGQFKTHFLGRLRHPSCGWTGYIGTGSYIAFQFAQTIHSGIRAGGSVKEDADKKGEKHSWVTGLFVFLFVGVFRAAAAVVLVPLHLHISLCDPGQTKDELVKRAAWLGALLAIIGIGWYEAKDLVKASPGMRSAAPIAPQIAPQTVILGKWYPSGFVPRAIEAGYEFLGNGQLMTVPFKPADNNPRIFRAEAPMRGVWSFAANSLNINGAPYQIIRLTQTELVIAMSNGVQIAYSRQHGPYPPFNSTAPIRKKKKIK